jgi:hypothetical protein
MNTQAQQQEYDALNNRLWLTECAMTPSDHYSRVNVRGIDQETLQMWIAEYPATEKKRDELWATMGANAHAHEAEANARASVNKRVLDVAHQAFEQQMAQIAAVKPRPPTARDLEKQQFHIVQFLKSDVDAHLRSEREFAAVLAANALQVAELRNSYAYREQQNALLQMVATLVKQAQQEDPTVAYDRAMKGVL